MQEGQWTAGIHGHLSNNWDAEKPAWIPRQVAPETTLLDIRQLAVCLGTNNENITRAA